MSDDLKKLDNEFKNVKKALKENLADYFDTFRRYGAEKDLDKKRVLKKEVDTKWEKQESLAALQKEIRTSTAHEYETSSEKKVVEAKIPWSKKREEFQKIQDAKTSNTNEKDKDRDKDDLEINR